MTTAKFNVTGMTCAACSAHVEKAVAAVPGVHEVTVSLLTNSMNVTFGSSVTPQNICDAVTSAGYGATPENGAAGKNQSTAREALEDHETPKLARKIGRAHV